MAILGPCNSNSLTLILSHCSHSDLLHTQQLLTSTGSHSRPFVIRHAISITLSLCRSRPAAQSWLKGKNRNSQAKLHTLTSQLFQYSWAYRHLSFLSPPIQAAACVYLGASEVSFVLLLRQHLLLVFQPLDQHCKAQEEHGTNT